MQNVHTGKRKEIVHTEFYKGKPAGNTYAQIVMSTNWQRGLVSYKLCVRHCTLGTTPVSTFPKEEVMGDIDACRPIALGQHGGVYTLYRTRRRSSRMVRDREGSLTLFTKLIMPLMHV